MKCFIHFARPLQRCGNFFAPFHQSSRCSLEFRAIHRSELYMESIVDGFLTSCGHKRYLGRCLGTSAHHTCRRSGPGIHRQRVIDEHHDKTSQLDRQPWLCRTISPCQPQIKRSRSIDLLTIQGSPSICMRVVVRADTLRNCSRRGMDERLVKYEHGHQITQRFRWR